MPNRWFVCPSPFELVDHTADVGLRVVASTPEEALSRLVLAYSQFVFDALTDVDLHDQELTVAASAPELLVVDLLREVNRRFHTAHTLPMAVSVLAYGATQVTVGLRVRTLTGEELATCQEVKAVTYHRACLRLDDQWVTAQVVLDL